MMIIPLGALNILQTLEEAGFEAFLVGGCVRDLLLGCSPKDYDICTNATPEQMLSVFRGFSVYATGLKHGTLTVKSGEMYIEVTTYRIDGEYNDNRHPDSVEFISDLKEDLARRDFTINAMACEKDGTVIDLFNGQAALSNKMISCVGNAEARFEEDGLRILRGLRFSAVLGFDIDSETAIAMRSKKHLLSNVSPERIREEITKILIGDAAGKVLCEFSDIIFEVLPELAVTRGFMQNNPHHDVDVWEHTIKVVENAPALAVLRWAAVLHDIGKPHCYTEENGCGHFFGHSKISTELAGAVLSQLKFDNKTRDKILLLIKWHDTTLLPDSAFIKRRLNQIGEDNLRDLILLMRADTAGHSKFFRTERIDNLNGFEAELNRVIESKPCVTRKQLAVDGSDIIALGLKPGKEIGAALALLLEAVIDGKCNNDKAELLGYLAQTHKKGPSAIGDQ